MGIEFVTSIKLQLASICFLVALMVDFVRRKRVKLITTRWFTVMLVLTLVYLFSDILTVFTIRNMTDTLFNEICHKVFYTLLVSVVFSFSVYVELIGNTYNYHIKKWKIAVWVAPYIISLLFIIIGDVQYFVDEKGVYSMGGAVFALYIAIAVYTILIFVETYRYKAYISEAKRNALRLQLALWIGIAVLQLVNPYLLLSGLGLSMSMVFLYFSFENPGENLDETTGAFNKKGFSQVFHEKMHCYSKGKYFLTAIVIEDRDNIVGNIGTLRYGELMKQVYDYLDELTTEDIYRIKTNIFVVLLPREKDILNCFLRRTERRFGKPFRLGESNILMKAKAVVMDCPEMAEDYNRMYQLILLGTKREETGFVCRINHELVNLAVRSEKISEMLKTAIENDGFEVVYQPIYSVNKKAFCSSEVLVRLKDKESIGFVSPEEFIPLAEEKGYVGEIGEIVFRKTCDMIKSLHERKLPISYIEVNLSALQIIDDGVTTSFQKILTAKKLPASCINLEITETAAVKSEKLFEKNMKAFRKMGCTFSMDDFGTGYSNLAKMVDIPYDIVKIDKSLIWPCFEQDKRTNNRNQKAQMILNNVVKMLLDLGLHIVAEGVETKEMAEMLMNLGVQYLQGYYYSRPISGEDYIAFLEAKRA